MHVNVSGATIAKVALGLGLGGVAGGWVAQEAGTDADGVPGGTTKAADYVLLSGLATMVGGMAAMAGGAMLHSHALMNAGKIAVIGGPAMLVGSMMGVKAGGDGPA